jgi:putative DNA primase/helicase
MTVVSPLSMLAENIPGELRPLDQWVNWHYEERAGKATKVPMRVDGQGRASTTDPETWGSFEEALAAVERFDGIGFVFGMDDAYTGVDIDRCGKDNGLLDPEAASLVLLLDSYTEWSPSGQGVHVILKGTVDGTAGRRKGRFEMYSHGRYFAMTGNHLVGTPGEIR